MVFPDYDRSILSITASLLRHFGAPAGAATLPELDQVLAGKRKVLWLIADGLGSEVLRRALPENAWLRRHTRATVTSVFPATTVAATTSYYAGKPPVEHGWLGWHLYFREYDADVTTFPSTDYYTGRRLAPPPAASLLGYETLFEQLRRADPALGLRAIAPVPGYFERGADVVQRINTLEQGLAALRRAAEGAERTLALMYWTQPDAAMHEHGVDSPRARAQYRAIDDALERLSAQLFDGGREDTLLLVSSDHGLTDVRETIDLAGRPEVMELLERPPSLEARAAAFFVRPCRQGAFDEWLRSELGEDFLRMSREEVLRSGLFGRGAPHPKFGDFIGDAMAIATGARCIEYTPPGRPRRELRARHAGLTPEEMWVDVMLDAGRGRE